MRLLNLWPDATRTRHAVRTSFSQELAGAILFTAILICAAFLYLRHQSRQIDAVNTTLQKQLALIATNPANSSAAMPDKKYIDTRLNNAGQLNWLGILPELVDENTQLTQVLQKNNALHIFGRSTSAAQAHLFFERVSAHSNASAPVLASLEKHSTGQNTGWYFEVRVNNLSLDAGAR